MADEARDTLKRFATQQPDLEMARLTFEREKARLDYKKFVLGSVFVAIAIALIPPSFQLATAVLEYVKSQAKLLIDEQTAKADRETKEVEFRQRYIQAFVTNALDQDIELRIRLAEYFSSVSSESHRNGWTGYHQNLINRRDKIRKKIDEMEAEWQLQAAAGPTAEVERLERNLTWLYREVGYLEKNRSADPRNINRDAPVPPTALPLDAVRNETPVIPELKEAQKALGVANDGRYGVQTRAAIREFQTGMYRRNGFEWPITEITGNLTSRSGRVLPTLKPMPAIFMSPFERAYLGSDSSMFTADPLSTVDPRQLNLTLDFLGVAPEKIAAATTPEDKMKLLRERIAELRTTLNLPSPTPILDAALYAAVWRTSPFNVNMTP